jgi:hypothetical protein
MRPVERRLEGQQDARGHLFDECKDVTHRALDRWYPSSSMTVRRVFANGKINAITMLLQMFASREVSRLGKSRWWFALQNYELMQKNLLNESITMAF